MSETVLKTKLHPPIPSRGVVSRSRLLEKLGESPGGALTLICAPAGFGKTTLLASWVASLASPVAWLSLDEADDDLATFLRGLIAALETVDPGVGEGVLSLLRSPQLPTVEALLTPLLNELTALPERSILVLDDYHLLEEPRLGKATTFLVEHLPTRLSLVIATREDPPLPLPRIRAGGRLNELRVRDLRFTRTEARAFFEALELKLTEEEIDALEGRTEGWAAGLQLAAISLQGEDNREAFIRSFTGSHRFVLDYLLEEVLEKQPVEVQRFLLATAVLRRLSGPLCDAVLGEPEGSGQATLERLERSNLFLLPLDDERRWYRYHHLFRDLLRQRSEVPEAELHRRASRWYEKEGLLLEAFHHAAAAGETERAEALARGDQTPLHLRGGVAEVLAWLGSLPTSLLDERPELWVLYASALSTVARKKEVIEKLRRAEAALSLRESGPAVKDLQGQIAAIRAMEAAGDYEIETLLTESRRALTLLDPGNISPRIGATWTLGFAHQIRGERGAAREAYSDAIALSRSTGNTFMEILAATGLGIIKETETELHAAEATYRSALALVEDRTEPALCEAHLGLARLAYERNGVEEAENQARRAYHLAVKIPVVDTYVACRVLQAEIALASGEFPRAEKLLQDARAEASSRGFLEQLPRIAETEVRLLLRRGELEEALLHARREAAPLAEARARLAEGDGGAAVAILAPLRQEARAADRKDELLRLSVLEAAARSAGGEITAATALLEETLPVAEREGYLRLFLDEGEAVRKLLSLSAEGGLRRSYLGRLLSAFRRELTTPGTPRLAETKEQLPEPLSRREIEILRLIAEGLSNEEIGERLFISLSTVKGHNQNIYAKLRVRRRTEAVARVRELGLL